MNAPNQDNTPVKESDFLRFAGKFEVDDESGCWPWQAYITRKGYGSFKLGPGMVAAHRAAYILSVGPIPEGLVLDHLCRNRACVNPDHLEPVTAEENTARGVESRTSCYNGHPYTSETTAPHPGGSGRRCLTCAKEWDKANVDRKQTEAYRESQRRAARKWRVNNLERVLEYQRQYREDKRAGK